MSRGRWSIGAVGTVRSGWSCSETGLKTSGEWESFFLCCFTTVSTGVLTLARYSQSAYSAATTPARPRRKRRRQGALPPPDEESKPERGPSGPGHTAPQRGGCVPLLTPPPGSCLATFLNWGFAFEPQMGNNLSNDFLNSPKNGTFLIPL